MTPPTTSFVIKRVNSTTFGIQERDKYREHPLIYAKIHPAAPIVMLSDTGCDAPAEEFRDADFTHLRQLLEEYPVAENNNKPLNPKGVWTYVIILTHCHYDHIAGVPQFLKGGTTEIIASAAGRDFIESDLAAHSLCKQMGVPAPVYKVTHWAQSYERLTWPLAKHLPGDLERGEQACSAKAINLEIDIIHTPGHTPDELAWADLAERTVYVGDSFYHLGDDAMPIIFPPQGNLIDWEYSMHRLADYIFFHLGAEPDSSSSSSDTNDWTLVSKPVKISAAHQTVNQPAFSTWMTLITFFEDVVAGKSPALYSDVSYGEVYTYWISEAGGRKPQEMMALWCPQRLMDDLRAFWANVPGRELRTVRLLQAMQPAGSEFGVHDQSQ